MLRGSSKYAKRNRAFRWNCTLSGVGGHYMVDRVVFYRNSQFALSIIQRGARCNTFRSALSRDYTAHCGRGSGEERADVRSYLLEIGHPTAADEHPWRCQLDKGPASNAITLSTYGQYRLGGGEASQGGVHP